MARQPGDKLGPRLAQIVTQHTVAARQALAPVEASIGAAITQKLIDRAGAEVASLYRPLTSAMLESAPNLDPMAAEFIRKAASGTHQWEALAGHFAMTSINGGLQEILANYMAPAVYQLVQDHPNLVIDQNTAAAATAAGIITMADGTAVAAQNGYNADEFIPLYQLAQNGPTPAVIYNLLNRGLITRPGAVYWLTRAAVPPELQDAILALGTQVLDAAEAALAVVRNNITADEGMAAAAAQGITADNFTTLVNNTGEPLALEEMLLLYRWGKMDKTTLERGILQSRVRDEWIPYAEMLGIVPPSGAEVVDALVKGQIDQATALQRWTISGGDPTWFDTAVSSNANPPSPTQLAEMVHRGVIPLKGTGPDVLSFQQGIYEGRIKDKWEPAYEGIMDYHPPPREISTLVREGGLTQDQAMTLWEQAGLTPDLANIYWQAAFYQKSTALHELAQGEITKLYEDQAITRPEAIQMLQGVNWTEDDANWLLDLADYTAKQKMLNAAVTSIRTRYIAWKITDAQVTQSLIGLEVAATTAAQWLAIWKLEQQANVKTLTQAEICDAWYYELYDTPEDAQADLQKLGYSAHEAWMLLNIKNKGPIDNYPDPESS